VSCLLTDCFRVGVEMSDSTDRRCTAVRMKEVMEKTFLLHGPVEHEMVAYQRPRECGGVLVPLIKEVARFDGGGSMSSFATYTHDGRNYRQHMCLSCGLVYCHEVYR